MTLPRRDFLKLGIGSSLSLTLSPWLVGGWPESAHAAVNPRLSHRHLVILELTGGNDALNMIAPVGDDLYHRARPVLRISPEAALPIDTHYGWHPNMQGLHDLFQQGSVNIVHGVGTDSPDRSHFRSLDIWHSALPNESHPATGWIGRTADQRASASPLAMRLGSHDLPLLLRSRHSDVPTLERLEDYIPRPRQQDVRPQQSKLLSVERAAGTLAEQIRRKTQASLNEAQRLGETVNARRHVSYPESKLAADLRLAALLCEQQLAPPILFVNQEGYDTHSRQAEAHGELLGTLSAALHAFFADLDSRGKADEVLVMVYSEFGRRVAENASGGTDHGAAAPVLFISGALKGGLTGKGPALDDLDDGDLRAHTDFRRVYSTALTRWLGVEHSLPTKFAPLPIF